MYAVIDVACAVFTWFYVDRSGHATWLCLFVEDSDIEFVWMPAESVGGGHTRGTAADDSDLCARRRHGDSLVSRMPFGTTK